MAELRMTIEYVKNPKEPTTSQLWNNERFLFGAYKVDYSDGFHVMIPHQGWLNTISAEPLDLDDPEHRAVVENEAERIREAHGRD